MMQSAIIITITSITRESNVAVAAATESNTCVHTTGTLRRYAARCKQRRDVIPDNGNGGGERKGRKRKNTANTEKKSDRQVAELREAH
jgi:hypothetical protein